MNIIALEETSLKSVKKDAIVRLTNKLGKWRLKQIYNQWILILVIENNYQSPYLGPINRQFPKIPLFLGNFKDFLNVLNLWLLQMFI